MKNVIEIGDTVILSNIKTDEIETFSIVKLHFENKIVGTDLSKYDNKWVPVFQEIPMENLDINNGEISHNSPMAKKLIGHELNSILDLPNEDGIITKYKIIKIIKETHDKL